MHRPDEHRDAHGDGKEQQVKVEEALVITAVTFSIRQRHELVPVRVPGAEERRGPELGKQETKLVGHAVETDDGYAPAGLQKNRSPKVSRKLPAQVTW